MERTPRMDTVTAYQVRYADETRFHKQLQEGRTQGNFLCPILETNRRFQKLLAIAGW
jgi:hypothetical protein